MEEFFELPLERLPPFHGYIDLIEQSADREVTIVDLDAASKKPTGVNLHGNKPASVLSRK